MKSFTIQVQWIDVATAAQLSGIKQHLFYLQIRKAKNFPGHSPFKRGEHWRQVSDKKLQINIEKWLEALDKL